MNDDLKDFLGPGIESREMQTVGTAESVSTTKANTILSSRRSRPRSLSVRVIMTVIPLLKPERRIQSLALRRF